MTEQRTMTGAVISSGGWCAPSSVLYDVAQIVSTDDIFTIPVIQSDRAGIRYSTAPPSAEARLKNERHTQRTEQWRAKKPKANPVAEVWLAVREWSYDDSEILEVCATRKRAKQVCEHTAAEPSINRQPEKIRWRNSGDKHKGVANAIVYRLVRHEVMG